MPELSTIAGIVEPLRTYNWEVQVVRSPSGVNLPDNLRFRARSCSVPGKSFDTIEVQYKWMTWRVHGRESSDKTVEITFWEGVDMAVYNALDNWRKAVGDWLTGRQKTKAEVSGDIQIQLQDSQERSIKTFVLKNAYLQDLAAIELSYDTSAVVEVRATFVFDWIEER